MKKSIYLLLLFSFSLFFFKSCKDKTSLDDSFQIDFGYDYFPLEIGKYRDYQVDSTIFDFGPGGGTITHNSTTYLREQVIDTLTDNLNRVGYKIERFERSNLTDPWTVKDVWMFIRTDQQAESLEENLRFIKLVFPLKEGVVWNGNQFIDDATIISIAGESIEVFKSWEYNVDFVGEPITVNNEVYENGVQITQADNENLIELRYSIEQYAENIGLVFKEMKILDTQCIAECEGQPWEEKAEKGFIVRQELIGHN